MKKVTLIARIFAGSIGLLLGVASTAQANTIYHVVFDTSSLIGNSSGPFYLDFQFIDGSGLGNANNTATLGNFDFGGGSAGGAVTSFGGVSGNLGSQITFTDSFFFNEFFQSFTPGSIFAFDLTLTGAVESPAPDAFSFTILDGNLFNIPTSHPANNSLFHAEIGGAVVVSSGTGDYSGITGRISSVPDSGPALSGLLLLGCCVDYLRRRGQRLAR